MREYYNFMAPENFSVNAPNNWAMAIEKIEAADQKIDPARSPSRRSVSMTSNSIGITTI